jgi:hypothetical protein
MGEPQPSWYLPEAWRVRQAAAASPLLHRLAWQTRALWWKLDANQWRLYQKLKINGRKRKILNCSRRIGKTYLLAADADEFAWKNPKSRTVFAAPTLKDLEDIVLEAFEEWLSDCPEDLRPQWLPTKKRFRYPNGAEIRLIGCDDRRKANRGRGRAIHRVYIEEAGSNPVLKYLIGSVLGPTLLSTGGEMWIASSPPDTEEHEFAEMVRTAEADGVLAHCEIYDCPRYTREEVGAFIKEEADLLGMTVEEYKETAEYKREFRGLLVTDPARAVIPEATADRMEAGAEGITGRDGKAPAIIRTLPDVPLFRDRWVAMDLGFHPHFTHLLFAYWDYRRQVLVIEDEFFRHRLNDSELAALVKEKEQELWGDHRPFLRVADNNYPMTLSELAVTHGLVFVPTAKDEKEAAIVHVRRWVRQGKIAIHPRCKALISQLKGAIWNKHRTEFEAQPNGGHYDAVDALIYLVRNVIPHENREPEGWGFVEQRDIRGWAEEDRNAALTEALGGY